jgi:hypothetical protein
MALTNQQNRERNIESFKEKQMDLTSTDKLKEKGKLRTTT